MMFPRAASSSSRRLLRHAVGLRYASSSQSEGRIVVVTSGKGGVGKTTSTASLGFGLAQRGHKTCVVDFDMGLRNLDLHLGAERRVIFDFIHVMEGTCRLNQALIRDKRNENLFLLAASQTKDKEALTDKGVYSVLTALKSQFDYVLVDSPAGIENGAKHAMQYADDAIIVTNPEISSCRDSDKMIGFISSKSMKAQAGDEEGVRQFLLINRYDAARASEDDSLAVDDITEMLGLPLAGVIPESSQVLASSNAGTPVIASVKNDNSDTSSSSAAIAFDDTVARLLGEDREMKFLTPESGDETFFKRWFG